MASQALGELLVELVPAGQVVDGQDAGEGAVALRSDDVGVKRATISSSSTSPLAASVPRSS